MISFGSSREVVEVNSLSVKRLANKTIKQTQKGHGMRRIN